jgi:hypothetical protein
MRSTHGLRVPHPEIGSALAPELPPALIGPPEWLALTALMARLPAAFSWGIFECRLAPDPRVDLLLCLVRDRGAARGLLGEALPSIAAFLVAWHDDPRLAASPLCWIEHDLAGERPSPPFVQLCVDPSYPRCDQAPLAPEAVAAIAAAGIAPLLGRPAAPGALAQLVIAADRLPPTGRILHVGVIPHRGRTALRVLATMAVGDALSWLAAIGWPGDVRRAAELVALLGGRIPRVSIQLDLEDAVGPAVAVEFPFEAESGAHPAWQAFMAGLVARGLADPAKAQAALGWIGHRSHELADAVWRVGIGRQLDVKVTLAADGRFEAKAYLSFHPAYVVL